MWTQPGDEMVYGHVTRSSHRWSRRNLVWMCAWQTVWKMNEVIWLIHDWFFISWKINRVKVVWFCKVRSNVPRWMAERRQRNCTYTPPFPSPPYTPGASSRFLSPFLSPVFACWDSFSDDRTPCDNPEGCHANATCSDDGFCECKEDLCGDGVNACRDRCICRWLVDQF